MVEASRRYYVRHEFKSLEILDVPTDKIHRKA